MPPPRSCTWDRKFIVSNELFLSYKSTKPMNYLPNPRHLRYLCVLAATVHCGRAAVPCAVRQSTLSAGIHELEAQLGASLVERTKRRVVLTPLGHEIVARAQRVLREIEDLVEHARSHQDPLVGEL